MRTGVSRAGARLPIFSALLALVLAVGASSIVAGASPAPIAPVPATSVVPAGSVVRVDVTGTKDDGTAVTASAYGVIVDASGLVLAPANVVQPSAPGVAVSWQWPFLGYNVSQLIVSTSTGTGAFKPTYIASVVATDGLLDAAVLKLDSAISPTGTAVTIPPGTLDLPTVHLAAADPAPSTPVVFATYAETGTAPTGAGTWSQTPGTVSGFAKDVHIPDKNYWLNTDIATPVAYPGGPIVDGSGALVAMATWLSDSAPEHVYGPTASLLTPLVAAAKAGTPYVSPYLVPGSGAEAATLIGFGAPTATSCTGTPVTSYPTGTTAISVMFSFTGFTDGEDNLNLWFDSVQQQILTYGLHQWSSGAAGPCYLPGVDAGTTALPDSTYVYNLFAGGNLRFVGGAQTVVGQPGAGAVKVTGKVVDADTGKPVVFAFVYILKAGVDGQTWLQGGTSADVASTGLTDDQGLYTTDPAITPGPYSIAVVPFDNHQTITGTVTVPADGKLADIVLAPTH